MRICPPERDSIQKSSDWPQHRCHDLDTSQAVTGIHSGLSLLQEELEVLDRVRYGPDTATSPCLQKIVDSEEDGGCGRQFNSSFDPEPTNTTEFDIEFGFSASPAAKGVIFQCALLLSILSFWHMKTVAGETAHGFIQYMHACMARPCVHATLRCWHVIGCALLYTCHSVSHTDSLRNGS